MATLSASFCSRATQLFAFVLALNCYLVVFANQNVAAVHLQQRSSSPTQQQPTASGKRLRLTKIEVIGLRRNKLDDVVRQSGLQIGQAIEQAQLDAAAQRLIDSGLFAKVGYRFRYDATSNATVTFQVEEAENAQLPAVFDNFVWFTPEEIAARIKRSIATYDGTVPEQGIVAEEIARILQRMMQERSITGQVEHLASADASGVAREYIFSVAGARIPICELSFPGAVQIAEKDLTESAKQLLRESYSRSFAAQFADANLLPLYLKRGNLRAKFGAPTAVVKQSETCEKESVRVTIPVEEGAAYSWKSAEWTGTSALANTELDQVLGMKTGEVADGIRFRAGLVKVRDAFGAKGYILARVQPSPIYDDAAKTVSYNINVAQGEQYRMGKFDVVGMSAEDSDRLRQRWRLAPGAIYDATYLAEFIKLVPPPVAANAQQQSVRSLSVEVKPDRERKTINVTIGYR